MERRGETGLRIGALGVCALMLCTLPFPWVTIVSTPWLGSGPTTLRTRTGLSYEAVRCLPLALAPIAGLQLLVLLRWKRGWPRGVALGASGLFATLGLLLLTFEPRFEIFNQLVRQPAIVVFDLLWLALILLHLPDLFRALYWLATGPPRTPRREVASAIGLGLPLAAVFGGAAGAIEATWPGVLSGGGALLVPVPLAVTLSAAAAGFGLALWFRLRRRRSVEGEAA